MENPFPNGIPFLDKFGTRRGRWLADRLGLSGKNSETIAGDVSAFFWNLQAAITYEAIKKCPTEGNLYAKACRSIFGDITKRSGYTSLPAWVRHDLTLSAKFLSSIEAK